MKPILIKNVGVVEFTGLTIDNLTKETRYHYALSGNKAVKKAITTKPINANVKEITSLKWF